MSNSLFFLVSILFNCFMLFYAGMQAAAGKVVLALFLGLGGMAGVILGALLLGAELVRRMRQIKENEEEGEE